MRRFLLTVPAAMLAASRLPAATRARGRPPLHGNHRSGLSRRERDSAARCHVYALRTRVDGNVWVKGDAKLVARGVRVDGNIQAENHRSVLVQPRNVNDPHPLTRQTCQGVVDAFRLAAS